MTLVQTQQAFSQLIARLIIWIGEQGYGVTLGEAYRPPEMAQIYASEGKGIIHSNHTLRLAMDLNLFQGETVLWCGVAYQKAGEYWKSLSTSDYQCCWGGDFSPSPDTDHFSIEWQGVK